MKKIGICGIPSGLGCALPGTQHGPNKLREIGLLKNLETLGTTFQDFGDVMAPEDYPAHNSADNAKHLDKLTAWNQALHTQVSEILGTGSKPVVLGGDHSYAIGSISAVAKHCQKKGKKLAVIWFDAHTDFNTPKTSPTGNIHGMPVKVLTGHGPTPLLDIVHPHFVPESAFHMVGIRSVDPLEQIAVDNSQMSIHTMKSIEERGIDPILEDIFSTFDENTHLHFSFDIDGIDPDLAPGVGTPVQDGLSLEHTRTIFSRIKGSGLLGSMDVVELNPDQDNQDKTAVLAAQLVSSLF